MVFEIALGASDFTCSQNIRADRLEQALIFVAAIANCALGIYAGVETAITSFAGGFGKPMSCSAPNAP